MSHLNDNWLATTWPWVCVIFATIWKSVKWCWINFLIGCFEMSRKKRAPVVEDDVRQPDFVRRNIETPHSAVVVGVPRQAKVVPLLNNTRVPCNDHKTSIIKRIQLLAWLINVSYRHSVDAYVMSYFMFSLDLCYCTLEDAVISFYRPLRLDQNILILQ